MIVASRPAALSVTFDDGEDIADPGTVTVSVVRADGTAQAVAASVSGTGAAARSVALTAAEVGDSPDLLTVTWASTLQGTITEYVDVVGRRFVLLSAIRDGKDSNRAYPSTDLRRALDWFENLAEDHCQVAFRPRYAVDTFYPSTGVHLTTWPRVRSLEWATVDGESVDVSDWDFDGAVVCHPALSRHAKVRLGYTHGYDTPPVRLQDATVVACQDWLRGNKGDRRQARLLTTTDQYGNTERMARAGTKYPTGIDVVDATLNQLAEGAPAL